jgi:hypothetical protein
MPHIYHCVVVAVDGADQETQAGSVSSMCISAMILSKTIHLIGVSSARWTIARVQCLPSVGLLPAVQPLLSIVDGSAISWRLPLYFPSKRCSFQFCVLRDPQWLLFDEPEYLYDFFFRLPCIYIRYRLGGYVRPQLTPVPENMTRVYKIMISYNTCPYDIDKY